MRERIQRWMSGRNGNDQFNMFLLLAGLLFLLLSSVFSKSFGPYLYPFVLILLGYSYFRRLSRDIPRRALENSRYLAEREKLSAALRLLRDRWTQRKSYKFFRCPACRAVLRVPRGRGKLKIVCRRCGSSFTGRS